MAGVTEYDLVTVEPDDGFDHLAVPRGLYVPVDTADISTLCGQRAVALAGRTTDRPCPACATSRGHYGVISGEAT